jgi:hypothetical protein
MKRILLASVMALATTAAVAQSSSTTTTTTTTAPGTTGTVTIAPEQRTAIRSYITQEKVTSVPAPSGFTVSTGAVLPQSVELRTFPSSVGVTQYRYVVINDRTVLVDPSTRRIIQVIE